MKELKNKEMKELTWMVGAMLCAMVCFTACSDDDDNNGGGNGDGAGDGGSGVEVEVRKLVRVEEQGEGESVKDITLFEYDSEGRLSKITETDDAGGDEIVREVTYSDGRVTVAGKHSEDVYVLNGEGDVESLTYEGEDWREVYAYSYLDGFLSRMTFAYYEYVDGEWVKEEPEEVTEYMVADSNLSKCVSRYGSMESERTVEASSTLNNMNIDYLYAQWLGNGDEFLLCIAGKRYRNLPARVTDGDDVTTYEYTVDGDGYVTKAVEKYGNYTYTYWFYYE